MWLTLSWAVLFAAAAGELAGQLLLKRGLDQLEPNPSGSFLRQLLRNRLVLLGLCFLAFWMGGYLFALRTLDVSAAFPAQSINAFLLVLAARLILREKVRWPRWLGAGCIAIGVYLVAT